MTERILKTGQFLREKLAQSPYFCKHPVEEKRAYVDKTLGKLEQYMTLPFATSAATKLWQERIGFYREFYGRLLAQLEQSGGFSSPAETGTPPETSDALFALARQIK